MSNRAPPFPYTFVPYFAPRALAGCVLEQRVPRAAHDGRAVQYNADTIGWGDIAVTSRGGQSALDDSALQLCEDRRGGTASAGGAPASPRLRVSQGGTKTMYV